MNEDLIGVLCTITHQDQRDGGGGNGDEVNELEFANPYYILFILYATRARTVSESGFCLYAASWACRQKRVPMV